MSNAVRLYWSPRWSVVSLALNATWVCFRIQARHYKRICKSGYRIYYYIYLIVVIIVINIIIIIIVVVVVVIIIVIITTIMMII